MEILKLHQLTDDECPTKKAPRQPKFLPMHHKFLIAYDVAGTTGLTDIDMSMTLNVTKENAKCRRVELAALGFVVQNGSKRKTPQGRNARVWIITEFGINQVQNMKGQS